MGALEDKERPLKRTRTGVSSGDLMDVTLGSKGLVKKSEFIRIITDALISLGFDDIAANLEKKSGIPLHDHNTKEFLELVKKREWGKSIDELKRFELHDEKAVRLLLLEQKYFDFVKNKKDDDALRILREDIWPLCGNIKRIENLLAKLISGLAEDTEVVKKLQELFPPAVIFPEKRLEYLLEDFLDRERCFCDFHNIPDSDLYLCSRHYCGVQKIPSETVQILREHTDKVLFLAFSHNGKYLASSSEDKSAILWEIDIEGKFSLKHKLVGHEKPVVTVLWSPDDRQVITCGENEVIMRWDVDSGVLVRSYERNCIGSVSCGWLHDGSGIIGAMADRRIYLWSLDGTELEHEQDQRAEELTDVAMTTDGEWLVSLGREKRSISLFDRETRDETMIKVEDFITSFSLSKDNKHLLIVLITNEIQLWNIDGEPDKVSVFDGHMCNRFTIRSCFGGYKEAFIACGSETTQVYIWHRENGREPCGVLLGHSGAVNCVSWNPTDLQMLASASDDGTIRIWGINKESDIIQW